MEQESFNEEDFYEEGEDLTQTTLAGLNNLCKQVTHMREEVSTDEAALKAKKLELSKMEGAVLEILQKNNMQNYSSEYGTFYQIEKVSVRLPQGEDKQWEYQ